MLKKVCSASSGLVNATAMPLATFRVAGVKTPGDRTTVGPAVGGAVEDVGGGVVVPVGGGVVVPVGGGVVVAVGAGVAT